MSKEEMLVIRRAIEWLEFFDKNFCFAPSVKPTIRRLRKMIRATVPTTEGREP